MKNNYPTNLRMPSLRYVGWTGFFIGILTLLLSLNTNAQVVCDPELKFTVQSTLNSAEGVDDATLRVTGLDPAVDYIVAYELGTTFTGSIASGAAYSTFTDGVIANNLPNPASPAGQQYVVRVYLPDNSCYAEQVYTLPRAYFNNEPDNTDVEVIMTKSGDATEPGDIVTVTVTVRNNNTDNTGYNIIQADNVEVTVTNPVGADIVPTGTPNASQGTYNGGTFVWTVGSLAPGQVETLEIQYIVNDRGIFEIAAEVTNADGDDLDSEPNNNNIIEDDYMTQCLATPFDYCDDDEFEFRLADPSLYGSIQYTKNGTPITGDVAGEYRFDPSGFLIIESIGTYSYQSIDPTACGFQFCCPIIVEEGVRPDIAPITPVSICYESPIADVVVVENRVPADFADDRGSLVYQWFSDAGTGNPISGSDSLAGYTSLTLNFDALPQTPGTYTYRIIGMDDLHQTCKDTAEFVVVIQDIEKPIAASNSPICEEETLELTTTNMADYQSGAPFQFTWWNENDNGGAWTATGDSVGRTNALPAMSDNYIVEVSVEYTNFTPAQTVTCTKTDTVEVIINPLPPLPDPIDYIYCQGVTDAEMDSLRLNNEDPAYTIRWYAPADTSLLNTYPSVRPFPSSLEDGSTAWLVSFYNETTTCESHFETQQVTIDPKPEMPEVTNYAFCEDGTATDLAATALASHELIWYGIDSVATTPDTVALYSPPPSTATVGITTYFVSQYNTATQCQSFINQFEVHILDSPDDLAFDVPEYCLDTPPGDIVSLDNHLTVSPTSTSAPTPSVSYSWDYPGNADPAVAPTPTADAVGATYGTVTEIFTYDYIPADNFQVATIDCPSDVLPVHAVINPKPEAEVIAISALCLGDTSVDNGTLILTRFENTDRLEWNRGSTYDTDPGEMYTNEDPINEAVHGGVFASTLPNPPSGTSQDYHVRITNVHGCVQDIVAPLDSKDCVCPGGYCEPATVTPNF